MCIMDKQQGPTYRTGNYIQYPVINHNRKKYDKKCVCVYIYIYINIYIYIKLNHCGIAVIIVIHHIVIQLYP